MSSNSGIIVQKFGGSSLTKKEYREKVIKHIISQVKCDKKVVVVVSAIGRKGDPYATDTLINHIKNNGNSLENREMDLILSCGEIISATTISSMLGEYGIINIVLTGGQAGIITNDNFSNAQIKNIYPERINNELDSGKVVIVTGFQGVNEDGDITTLGRGGSDTTATALGVALHAEMVDIFTDVEGIMSVDPRIINDAEQLTAVTYEEICNLTNQGAKVIHPRAVEIAMEKKVPIRVRSTFTNDEGTLVTSNDEVKKIKKKLNYSDRIITGITQLPNLVQIKVMTKSEQNDIQMKIFEAVAKKNISLDFINVNQTGVAFTVNENIADKTLQILISLDCEPIVKKECAKISIVGVGMAGVPGVMAYIVEALADEDIQILQSADSHSTIWVLVKQKYMEKAIKALYEKFYLISKSE